MHSSPGGSQGSPGGGERVSLDLRISYTRCPDFHPIDRGICPQKQAQQSLRPVTIKQILSVEQSHSDSELAIDQVEVGQVRLKRFWTA